MNGRGTAGCEEYLLELLASAVNQRETLFRRQNISWEQLYKTADYHHVSNLIYYKIMWEDARGLQRWKEKFKERYQLAIKLQEQYSKLEEKLAGQFQKRQVHVLFLGNGLFAPYYPYSEMRMPQTFRILVEKGRVKEAGEILEETGFHLEEKPSEKHSCRLYRMRDLKAEVMDRLPFVDKEAKSWFKNLVMQLPHEEEQKYIHCMNEEVLFLYLITDISQRYAEGEAELRDVLDLWVLLKACGQDMEWKSIWKEIGDLKLEVFTRYFLHLTGACFGNMQFTEEADVLRDMQAYLLTKGQEARRENEKLFPIIKSVADNYYRNLRKEEKRRERQMKYPSMEYMRTVFPILDTLPCLLPLCWVVRMAKTKEYVLRERAKERKKEKEEE